MSDQVQLPTTFDAFADAQAEDASFVFKDYVHMRIQQRNGKKTLTTLQGIRTDFSYAKILRDLKREFCCSGTVLEDKELGKIIQLSGDQRKNAANFLAQAGIAKKDLIKFHGF